MPREQPIKKRGADVARMRRARRTGRKPDADFLIDLMFNHGASGCHCEADVHRLKQSYQRVEDSRLINRLYRDCRITSPRLPKGDGARNDNKYHSAAILVIGCRTEWTSSTACVIGAQR